MISPNVSREYLNIGDGHSGWGGGGTVGGWVGGGIAFLFLVFIIFGIGFFLHSRHDGVENNIRETNRLSGPELLAAAYARGEQNVRAANTLAIVEGIANRVTALAGEVRDAANMNRATTIEAAQAIVEQGRTFGFRTFDVTYPDPCRDRCGEGRGFDRDERAFARLRGTFALPTATAPGTIDGTIDGRVV